MQKLTTNSANMSMSAVKQTPMQKYNNFRMMGYASSRYVYLHGKIINKKTNDP